MLRVPEEYKKFAEENYPKNLGILPYYSIVASMLFHENHKDLDALAKQNVKRLGRHTSTMFDTILQTAVRVNVLVIDACKKDIMKEIKMHPHSSQYKIILYEYSENLEAATFFPLVTEHMLFSKEDAEIEIQRFFDSSETEDCFGLGSYVFYEQRHWKIIREISDHYVLESLDDSTKVMQAEKSEITKAVLPAQTPEQLQNRADYYKESDNIYVNKVHKFMEYVDQQNE